VFWRKKITRKDLARIKAELAIHLPNGYSTVLLEDPFKGEAQEFYGEADEILKQTKWNRDEGFFGLEWPDNYLVVGDDGAGNQYFIDLNRPESPVFFVDHEYAAVDNKWEITEEAASVRHWVARLPELWEEMGD
jgi:SMI1 / KNR4 family (SUKH-1)